MSREEVPSSKMKKTTNRDQFKQLEEAMKSSPDVAKNMTKRPPEKVKEFWEVLQTKLNSLGPPQKEVVEWKKVWSDHKSHLKKKMSPNKKEFKATGGGLNKKFSFTAEEEEVIDLIQLNESVEGIQNVLSFGTQSNEFPEVTQPVAEINSLPDVASPDEVLPETESPGVRRKVVQRVTQQNLLVKQISIQEHFFKSMATAMEGQKDSNTDLNAGIKRIYRSAEKLCDQNKELLAVIKEEAEEIRRHNEEMENFAKQHMMYEMEMKDISREKLMVKKKLLDLEIDKLSKTLNSVL